MLRQYKYQGSSGCYRSKKNKRQAKYRPFKRGLTSKIHVVCVSERTALKIRLSAGNCHDAPEGRKLISSINSNVCHYLLMDRAYEDDQTRLLAVNQGVIPVVPPKKNRRTPWKYDLLLYKRRNEVERLFLRIKRFRKVFTRYDKLHIIYFSVVLLALIFDSIFM